jgi:hypothetical protein
MKGRLLLWTLLMVILAACEEDPVDPPVTNEKKCKISMFPYWGNTPLQLDQTFFTNEGYQVQFTDVKCYFTSLKSGSNTFGTAALFDYRSNGSLVGNWINNPALFPNLSGYLGVDSAFNHSDPSAFSNDNPLNIMIANDMHWDWNPGYIFVKVEAKVDTLDDGIDQFDHFVLFHVGSDAILQSFNWDNLQWQDKGGGQFNLDLKLDLQKFVHHPTQPLNLKTEHTSHSMSGQESISLKVIENFLSAISLM